MLPCARTSYKTLIYKILNSLREKWFHKHLRCKDKIICLYKGIIFILLLINFMIIFIIIIDMYSFENFKKRYKNTYVFFTENILLSSLVKFK